MSAPTGVVWQIGAPSYADIFLKYGVGLIGPGDPGKWTADRDDSEFDGNFVRRIASEVQVGDVLLLRTGSTSIRAVGIVASDYQYLDQFDDVNGWDLQHARRVRWCALPQEHDFASQVFGANPARLRRVWNEDALDFASRFLNSPPTHWQSAPLPDLPPEEPALELDQVPGPLHAIIAEAKDLHPQYWDRDKFGELPREDELVAHLVAPLLRALGWPPERIAVKWRNIDVALFRELPRTPENCELVIEAKRLDVGVEGALSQGRGYVEALGVPRDVVLTDGVRYRLYSCESGFQPVAYANLVWLKRPAAKLFERLKRP